MIDGRRLDATGKGRMREEHHGEAVGPAGNGKPQPPGFGPDPREIGPEARYAFGIGRPINCT